MCGIVVAKDLDTFRALCRLNESRGDYSFGSLYLNDQGYLLQRKAGTLGAARYLNSAEFDIYLGHNRAPTSNVTCFDPNNAHPFVYGDWIVAHNGIIRNFQDLQELHGTKFEVDSNIIPFLLAQDNNIMGAFAQLVGTFGCWIYNTRTQAVYIYRSTNSLFYSQERNAVSSFQFRDSIMMKDNTLFLYTKDGVKELGTLESTESPFYIPD